MYSVTSCQLNIMAFITIPVLNIYLGKAEYLD